MDPQCSSTAEHSQQHLEQFDSRAYLDNLNGLHTDWKFNMENTRSKTMFPFLSCNMQVRKMRDCEFRFMSSWTHVTATLEQHSGNILMHKYLAAEASEPLWSLDMRDVVRHSTALLMLCSSMLRSRLST